MSLSGKSCIVTGAANGIGRAIARKLCEVGARVTLADMDEDALEKEVNALAEQGYEVQQFSGDLTERLSIANLIASTVDAFDQIDMLVNASRKIEYGDILTGDPELAEDLFQTNVMGTLRLTRKVVQRMMKQMEGDEDAEDRHYAIVNVTSIASQRTISNLGAYAVSSAALDQLTRSMAASLAEHKIRVNGIALGSVMSAWLRESLDDDEEMRERIIAATPMQRIGDSDEAANAAVFLASPESSFITGQIVVVDGGRTIIDPVGLPAY